VKVGVAYQQKSDGKMNGIEWKTWWIWLAIAAAILGANCLFSK
jgi:hypothetical protein